MDIKGEVRKTDFRFLNMMHDRVDEEAISFKD